MAEENEMMQNVINDDEQAEENGEELEPEQFRKMFIGGISYTTTKEKLEEHFGQYGELVDSVVMIDSKTDKSRGFGFVTFKHPASVDQVQDNRPHKIDGRIVEPRRAVPREDAGKPESSTKNKICKLYVGGLPNDAEDEHLREHFSSYGKLLNARIVTEKDSQKKRGFGFVEFDDYDPVDKIVLYNNSEINGKRVEVKRALSRQQIEDAKMGRRGGGGGGGRSNQFGSGGYRNNDSYYNGGSGGGWRSGGGGGGGYMGGGGGYNNYNNGGGYNMGSNYGGGYGGGPVRGGNYNSGRGSGGPYGRGGRNRNF